MNLKDLAQRCSTWLGQHLTRLREIRKPNLSRKQILFAAAIILILAFTAVALLARRTVRRGWPQTQGELTLPGLHAPVTIVRDRYGVPHIYAQTESDLFFAQGYVHAQDRFWQMDLNRRRGRGTLAEVLGDEAQTADAAWRNLDLAATAARNLAEMDAESRALLQAYAAGVNAWRERHRGRWPFEYTLLRWRGRAANEPDLWTAEDSLIVSLVVGWQVNAGRVDPSLATRVVARVGAERGAFLLGDAATGATQGDQATGALPARWALGGRVTLVNGEQTESGAPLLAVDLPTDLGLPAPWYVLAWRVGDERAAGASAPGMPGLAVGTGERAAGEAWLGLQESAPWGDEGAPYTLEELKARQAGAFSARAARLIPFLTQVQPRGWRQERVTDMLRHWDYEIGDNNREAPFFVVYQLELARAALADELGADLFEAFAAQGDLYQVALDRIIENPDDEWWDDVRTPERELRSDMLKRAYEPALEWMGRNFGDLHMLWEWDIVHGSRLQHPLGDAWPWDQFLNADLALDGWSDTVNASPGDGSQGRLRPGEGLRVRGDFFQARAAFGYRQIVDLGEPFTLWFALLPGQSGHPFHAHYDDLMDEWLAGEYLPLRLAASPQEVEGAKNVLILKPEEN